MPMFGLGSCANGMGMELDWLKDFLALAELRNFSRAADALGPCEPTTRL